MSSIPNGLRNVLANLEYLSMIEDGKKPCMNDMTFVDADSWIGASMRFFHGESREIMIVHINNIIDQGIHSLKEYPEFVHIILDSLGRAQMGIKKLMITYSKKPHTVSQLSVCCKNIQIQLNTFEVPDMEEYEAPEVPEEEESVSQKGKKGKKSASISIPKKG